MGMLFVMLFVLFVRFLTRDSSVVLTLRTFWRCHKVSHPGLHHTKWYFFPPAFLLKLLALRRVDRAAHVKSTPCQLRQGVGTRCGGQALEGAGHGEGRGETAIAAVWVSNGMDCYRVGFLPCHMVKHATTMGC